jgi:lysophospholipase L1-like esterase
MEPDPFLRGRAWPGTPKAPYPRAKPSDAMRLPVDTWAQAQIPAGVRLELIGDAAEIEIAYEVKSEDPGIRGPGGGVMFQLWRDGALVDEAKAEHPEGIGRLQLGSGRGKAIVYLPEILRPTLRDVRGIGGGIEPAPLGPRWICYGDSVAEGWMATAPAHGWAAIVAREHDLDLVNMGYAGAGRGEIVSAENIAELAAAVISITHGTNCWNRVPFGVDLFRAQLHAFLDIVRQGHRETPVLVASPILRPTAEDAPNRLGATLADLRAVMEDVVRERIAAGDERLRLVEGGRLITEAQLADDVHPNDDGHRALASALGPELADLLKRFPEKAA